MMRIIAQIKYDISMYIKGSSWVIPMVVIAAFLYSLYSVKPISIVGCFLVTGVVVYFIMVWIGMSISSKEDSVIKDIICNKRKF